MIPEGNYPLKEAAERCRLDPNEICFAYDDRLDAEGLRQNPEFRRVLRAYGLFLAKEAGIPIAERIAFLPNTLFRYYEEYGADKNLDQLLLALGEWHLQLSGGRTTVRRAYVFPGERPEVGKAVALGCTTAQQVRDGLVAIFREGGRLKQELAAKDGHGEEEYQVCAWLQAHQDPKRFSDDEVMAMQDGQYQGVVPKGCYVAVTKIHHDRIDCSMVGGAGQTREFRENGDNYTFTVYFDDGFMAPSITWKKGTQGRMLVATDRAGRDRDTYPFGEESLPLPQHILEQGPISISELSQVGGMVGRIYRHIRDYEPSDSPFRTGFRLEFQTGERGEFRCTELVPFERVETIGFSSEGTRKVIEVRKVEDLRRVQTVMNRNHGRRQKEKEEVFIYMPPGATDNDILRLSLLEMIRGYIQERPPAHRRKRSQHFVLLFGAPNSVGHGATDLIQAASRWGLRFLCVENLIIKDGWWLRLKVRQGRIEELYRVIDSARENVVGFDDMSLLDPAEAGRKVRTLLAFMRECAYRSRLPLVALDGFIIPRSVVEKLYRTNGLSDPTQKFREIWISAAGSMDELERRFNAYAQEVHRKLVAVPEDLIVACEEMLSQRGIPRLLAVRSATGAEDGGDPWAGGFGTVTRIQSREQLIDAILEVARSLWSERAGKHLRAHYRYEEVERLWPDYWMSIIVQRFMDISQVGGINYVMYSRSPHSSLAAYVEVAFTPHDCQELVDLKEGETLLIDRSDATVHVRSYRAEKGGEVIRPFVGNLVFDPQLLLELALQAEKFLGRTADIEGGFYRDDDGRAWLPLYQLRPVAGNNHLPFP